MQNDEIKLPDWLEIDLKNSSKHTIVVKKANLNPPNNNWFIEYGYSVKPENYVSLKAAKSAEAKRLLGFLLKEYNGDWVPDWNDKDQTKHVIIRFINVPRRWTSYMEYYFLAFPTEELRDKFLSRFERLIKDYFELD